MIPVLYHSAGLIAVDKPPGMNVHAAPGTGTSVLRDLKADWPDLELTPVHRLDRDASGVLLLAESKALASAVQKTWSSARKIYWALCDGIPSPEAGSISSPILENQTGKPERLRNAIRYFLETHPGARVDPLPAPKTSAVHPAGRASTTEYKLLESFGGFSALEIRPRQGRMHQIRVHLAWKCWPLAVDPLYGKRRELVEEEFTLTRIPLHAAQLEFEFAGRTVTVQAPLAADLERIVSVLRGADSVGDRAGSTK